MRLLKASYAVIAAAAVAGPAMAQNKADQWSKPPVADTPTTGQAGGGREAPIGHRQPRPNDLPPAVEQNLGTRSPEDQEVDRKLKICRDCD